MTSVTNQGGWRMVDIVVAAAVAVAFGVVFVAWNGLWLLAAPLFGFLPPAQGIMYGVWLLPGVLVGLIVRRPGAALFGGLVSAAVSLLLGTPWSADVLISGAAQGGGAELAFALFGYRWWSLPIAMLAGALAGLGAAIHDVIVWYPTTGVGYWVVFSASTILSGALIAGVGSWLLLRALIATGVLHEFAAGRDQREV
jgi:energy-coupling factor transport system substrate-specific component